MHGVPIFMATTTHMYVIPIFMQIRLIATVHEGDTTRLIQFD
jgi:membrane protein CcdC involved in cytochrome C biogenesis